MAYTTINKPSEYFNTVLYQSNNGTPQSITGVGFQPDFLWVKDRDGGGTHVLVDAVRGSTKWLGSDQTSGEVTRADQVTSFDSDGFSLGADSGNFINYSTNNNVSWNWLANGSGVSNTDGSITSTVSANTTSGFSIVKYVGTGSNATVGHGLGVAPKIVLVKDLSATASWRMFTEMTGNESQLALDQTSAADSGNTTMWNSTSPTTTTFSIGTHPNVNTSSNNYITYCFAEKKGFSKFGSYVGNSPTSQAEYNGPFIYTGFKPAFVILKQAIVGIVSGQAWYMHDNKRTPYNPSSEYLKPSSSDAEASAPPLIDLLSNGFKVNSGYSAYNDNGSTFIYMAFAENPLVGTNNIPATAR